jgi:hypothetical protein
MYMYACVFSVLGLRKIATVDLVESAATETSVTAVGSATTHLILVQLLLVA